MEPNESPSSARGGDHKLDEPLLVGPYELFRVLGEGGVATTYLGREVGAGRLVAVKALHLLRAKHRHHIDLFEREAEALRALSHPQIPDLFDTLVRATAETFTLYLVQEFVEGRSLARMLEDGYPFDDEEVVDIMLSCLAPLDYLHRQSPPLYHRDIKPSNIVMKNDGTCVLIDFGAVREALSDPKDAGSSVIGTFGYMAPEQFQARVNAATDLYSLGATALHLISGRSPKSFDVKRLKPDFHGSVDLDPHLAAILDLLLEPVDEDRYQSVAALRRALDRWRGEVAQAEAQARFAERSAANAAAAASAANAAAAVTKSPIILVSGDEVAAAAGRAPTPPLTPALRGQDSRDTPQAIESVGSQAMLLPSIRDDDNADDDRTSDTPLPQKPAAADRAGRVGPRLRLASESPDTITQSGPHGAGIPIRRRRESGWRALYPPARGYRLVGLVFLALAGMLAVLWRVRELGPAPLIVAGLLVTFGGSYFVFDWLRESRESSGGLLGSADGRLVRVDLTTTALGERYVSVHYEFQVEDRRYLGQATFTSRRDAQPFLRRTLPAMVWYDESQPERNTLERL